MLLGNESDGDTTLPFSDESFSLRIRGKDFTVRQLMKTWQHRTIGDDGSSTIQTKSRVFKSTVTP